MRISCVIPTANRPAYLREAVDSVLRQTMPAHEIVVVDNGADEAKLDDCPSERLRVHRIHAGAGASRARNTGAALATGDFLAFLDDDDMWGEKYLENVAAALGQGATCVLGRLDLLTEKLEVRKYKNIRGKVAINRLLVENPGVGGSNIVIAKRLFDEVGGFDETLPASNDKSLLIEVLRTGTQVVVLPENQVLLRQHRGPRLKDPAILAVGVYRFTKKYGALMDWQSYLYNWFKIYDNRYRSGRRRALVQRAGVRVLLELMNRIDRSGLRRRSSVK